MIGGGRDKNLKPEQGLPKAAALGATSPERGRGSLRREMTWADISPHQKAKRPMTKMPSIFMASHVDNVVKKHHWEWKNVEPKAMRSPLVKLIRRTPELEKSFDQKTGLPVVQLAVEIDKVMEVNVEACGQAEL